MPLDDKVYLYVERDYSRGSEFLGVGFVTDSGRKIVDMYKHRGHYEDAARRMIRVRYMLREIHHE